MIVPRWPTKSMGSTSTVNILVRGTKKRPATATMSSTAWIERKPSQIAGQNTLKNVAPERLRNHSWLTSAPENQDASIVQLSPSILPKLNPSACVTDGR